MIRLFRRLIGIGEEGLLAEAEFSKRLESVDTRNRELEALNAQLEDVLMRIHERRSQISVSDSEDAISGLDRVQLDVGGMYRGSPVSIK